jgi:hypothetical protein
LLEPGGGAASQADGLRPAPESAFALPLQRATAESDGEVEGGQGEAAQQQQQQLMVCSDWPLERVLAQAAWQFRLWPRRLLSAKVRDHCPPRSDGWSSGGI